MTNTIEEKPMWGIAQIGAALIWLEMLIVTISAPLLTGVGIASVADAFQGGMLLDHTPWLNTAYSWALGIGIEGQFAGMVYTAHRLDVNHHKGVWFYRSVAFILFCVGITTGAVVGYMQVYHVALADALASLSIQPLWWNWGRIVVMFGLIALSAHTRYVKPAARLSTEEELQEIDRHARIEAAKQQAAAQRLRGLAGIARGAIAGVRGQDNEVESPAPAPAFAAIGQGESPAEAPVNTAAEPPALDLKLKGKWWDAPSYKAYIAFAYGVGLTMDKSLDIVKQVGNGQQALERAGRPYIAARARLKAFAKDMYGDRQAGAIAGEMAGQYSE